MPRRRPDRGLRRTAIAVVMAGLVLPASGAAADEAAPTLTRATAVAGVALPEPLTDGEWRSVDGGWDLDLFSVAPARGETAVRATWRSRSFPARTGRVVFKTAMTSRHEPLAGTYEYLNEFRMCTSRTCYPWTGEGNDDVPSWVDPSTLPYQVEFGHGLALRWKARPATIRIEWRYSQTQREGSYARTTVRVVAGAAAG